MIAPRPSPIERQPLETLSTPSLLVRECGRLQCGFLNITITSSTPSEIAWLWLWLSTLPGRDQSHYQGPDGVLKMGTRIETWARDVGIRSIRVVGQRCGIQRFCLIPTAALRRCGLNGHPDRSSVGCHRVIRGICRIDDILSQYMATVKLSPGGFCDISVSDLPVTASTWGHGGDSWPTQLSVGKHGDCTRVAPCVWDAAISRRRCTHDHSLPSKSRVGPAQQAALAGAWKRTSWLSANTFAGGVEVQKMILR